MPRGAVLLLRPALASALAAAVGCGGHRVPPTVCPATGPVVLLGPEDVAALVRAGCARVPGLAVRTAAPLDLSRLTLLVAIDGDLTIGPTLAITTLTLPAVTEVRGTVRVSGNGDLTGLFLPALTRAGALTLDGDPSLASVSAPALTALSGALSLARLPSLELLDTRALTRVGGPLTVAGVPALATWLGPPPVVDGPVSIDAPALDPDARAAIDAAP